MAKSDFRVGAIAAKAHQDIGNFMPASQTDRAGGDLMGELGELLSSLADPEAMLGSQPAQWSHRRSLAFVVVSSITLWGVMALGITKIFALV